MTKNEMLMAMVRQPSLEDALSVVDTWVEIGNDSSVVPECCEILAWGYNLSPSQVLALMEEDGQ